MKRLYMHIYVCIYKYRQSIVGDTALQIFTEYQFNLVEMYVF